jgi:transposase
MGKPWSDEEVIELLLAIRDKKTHTEIAEKHKRTVGGITSRLRQLAWEYHTEGKSIDQIQKYTGLSKDTVLDAITKHEVSKANKEKKKEKKCKIQEIEQRQTKLEIHKGFQVEVPENEVLKYLKEIHSMLKELTSKAASNT